MMSHYHHKWAVHISFHFIYSLSLSPFFSLRLSICRNIHLNCMYDVKCKLFNNKTIWWISSKKMRTKIQTHTSHLNCNVFVIVFILKENVRFNKKHSFVNALIKIKYFNNVLQWRWLSACSLKCRSCVG